MLQVGATAINQPTNHTKDSIRKFADRTGNTNSQGSSKWPHSHYFTHTFAQRQENKDTMLKNTVYRRVYLISCFAQVY
jgi:hypothetical protein